MADVFGTQQAKANSVPMKMGDAHSMGGRMRVLSDSYLVPAAADVTATDVIVIGTIPKGARVWEAHLGTSASSGSGTISLGTRITDTYGTTVTAVAGLLAAAAHSSNFNRSIENGGTATTASVVPIAYADGAVIIAVGASTKLTSGVTITVTIKYTID